MPSSDGDDSGVLDCCWSTMAEWYVAASETTLTVL